MYYSAITLVTILLGVLSPALIWAQSHEWKLKKEIKDLKVYFRKSTDSKINELKIETVVNAPVATVVAAIRDVPMQPYWVYHCIEAERLHMVSETENYVYAKIDFPWPMSDRDYVVNSKLWQDTLAHEVVLHLSARPHYIPEKTDVVRIPLMEAVWKFKDLGNGKTKVTNHLKSDPAGTMPPWMVNLAIDQGPTRSMHNLKELVKKEKYQKAGLNFLKKSRKN
jgi:hypothetical protein